MSGGMYMKKSAVLDYTALLNVLSIRKRIYIYIYMETAVSQWLRRYATKRKVAGSIPFGVSGFSIGIKNSSDRIMALGSTHPLTEMSTKSISWG